MEKTSILSLPKPQRGLPGKSYIYLLDIDRELYTFLSYISHAPFFDYFISSLIRRYYRSNDRKKAVDNFLMFSVISNEDRLEHIYPSKIFDRVSCIKFLNMLYEGINKYTSIKEKLKNKKEITQDEFIFYSLFSKRWLINENISIRQIKETHKRVNNLVQQLYHAHLHFITKYLLKNRRGTHNVQDFSASAYEVVLEVINVYNPKRSKIPFFKLAQKYTYNYKNRIIKEETWGLDNSIIHLDALIDTKVLFENSNTEKKLSDEVYDVKIVKNDFEKELGTSIEEIDETEVLENEDEINVEQEESGNQTITIKNNIWKSIESSLYFEKKQDDKIKLLEMAYQSLPRPLKEITSILYELVDPLPIEQELGMLYNQKGEK